MIIIFFVGSSRRSGRPEEDPATAVGSIIVADPAPWCWIDVYGNCLQTFSGRVCSDPCTKGLRQGMPRVSVYRACFMRPHATCYISYDHAVIFLKKWIVPKSITFLVPVSKSMDNFCFYWRRGLLILRHSISQNFGLHVLCVEYSM